MRPTVLIDMDGPLADFDRHYWQEATERERRRGILHSIDCWDIPSLDDQRHRFLSDHLTDRQLEHEMRKLVNSPGWFESLPPVEGAAAAMEDLAEVADVWVCSKPLEANPTCRDEKARWLTEHIGAGWDKRLILAPDKSMIRGDVLLDDAIKAHWVPVATWTPVVYSAPFNQPGTKFGQDWPQFTWADGVASLIHRGA